MAEFEEVLAIVVKTKDETTAAAAKIDASLKTVEKQQSSLIRSQAALSKSSLGVADAFHMIIKRSPYVIGADFLARVLGAKSLMSGFSDVLDKGAEATRNMARQMLGADIEGEKLEARIQSIRDKVKDLNKAIAVREGIVDFGPNVKLGQFAPKVVLPENIRQLEEAQVAVLGAQAKLERLNETTHEGRERFLEQNDVLRDLNQQLIALSDKTKAAADAQEKLNKATREAERIRSEWKQTSNIAGTTALGKGAAQMMVESAASYASQAASLGVIALRERDHATALAEANEAGRKALGIAQTRVALQETMNKLLRAAQFIGSKVYASTETDVGYNVIRKQNDEIERQRTLWQDIGATVQYGVGAGIGAILDDVHHADEAIKNMLRSILSGINMQLGQSIAASIFGGWSGVNRSGGLDLPTSALGNVFSQGSLVPFARGGIVNGPTTFPMRGGAGLMGEAGPEAIMPLRRGPGGRLGVEAAGGGNVSVALTLNVGSLDPSTAASVIMANLRTIEDGIANSIAMGANQALRGSIAGVRR